MANQSFFDRASDAAGRAREGIESAQQYASDLGAQAGFPKSFLGGENTNRKLTTAAETLLATVEKTALRTYIGHGFSNVEKNKPNLRSVVTQTPEAIVLVTKRLFSSLAENFPQEQMNEEEKHFIRASKKLFQNKCEQISAYEKLTKVNKIILDSNYISNPIAQAIYQLIDQMEDSELNQGGGTGAFIASMGGSENAQNVGSSIGVSAGSKFNEQNMNAIYKNKNVFKKIRDVLTLNGFSQTTTWIGNTKSSKENNSGFGNGVIELTVVTNLDTTTSLDLDGGRAGFTVVDPYRLFFIDEQDIEKAINQTSYNKFALFNVVAEMLGAEIDEAKQQLNASRTSRNASALTYRIDTTTKIYNKVSIIVDNLGYELTKGDGSGIDVTTFNSNPSTPTYEKFTADEKNLLNRIYKDILKVLQMRTNDLVAYKNVNKNLNYVRKIMRLNYLSKQLVQPMDKVTIFIDSQTVDDKLLGMALKKGFSDFTQPLIDSGAFNIGGNVASIFGSTNFVGLLNKTVGDMKKLFGSTTGFSRDEAQKNILAGPDFPQWMWEKLRPNFVSNSFGTCAFVGIVDTVRESYNDGSYSLTVSIKSNVKNFEQGWVNTQPSTYQFNGFLFDPLTPYDFEFDAGTGLPPPVDRYTLLPENRKLLASGAIKVQDGKHEGKVVTEKNFGDPDVDLQAGLTQVGETYQNVAKRTYNAPDGFVYRWKTGIGTATINQSGSKDGLMANKLMQEDVAQVITEDPFAGQDIVNAVSIMICGEPYNFNTYFKAAQSFGAMNATTNSSPSNDYFQGLFRRIKKQNKIWGEFVPFKQFTTNPETFGKMMAVQSLLFAQSTSIAKKQRQKDQLLTKLNQFEADANVSEMALYNFTGVNTPTIALSERHAALASPILKQILVLSAEIDLHKQILKDSLADDSISKSVVTIANNAFFDGTNIESKSDYQNKLRLLVADQNELTKRRLWQVRANCDRNMFIVGSEYDSDYDIQTISTNLLSNFDFANNSWQTTKDKIATLIDKFLGMELFFNSQGHLELRTPKYNRIPSSVLLSMIKRKTDYGIQVYPSFLESMFKTQIEAVFQEIEIVEDQIRLHCMALGAFEQSSMQELLRGALTDQQFVFVTGVDGSMSSIKGAVDQIRNDYNDKYKNYQESWATIGGETADFFSRNENNQLVSNLKQAADTRNSFDPVKQIDNYGTIYKTFENSTLALSMFPNIINDVRTRLADKLAQPIDKIPTIELLAPNSKNGRISPIDINAIQSKLNTLVSRRYQAILSSINIIRNLDSAARVNSPDNDVLQKLLAPNLFGTENIPDFLLDMVENELVDDYGPGSGQRFVIREKDIISMEYQENDPEFTSIKISGSEMGGLTGGKGFDIGGGLSMSEAHAVDYDLWRMYGNKGATSAHMPFMSNAELQLAPYSVYLLNKERAKIFTASVTMRGNEFMQPGEVYYIEERGMLFYCKSVSHNFTYGGDFTTTLSLEYGRVPGEYIPTPLDVIGKSLYNGVHTNIGNYRIARTGTIGKEIGTHLGCFVYPNAEASNMTTTLPPVEEVWQGDKKWATINENLFQDILGKIVFLMGKTLPNESSKYQALTFRVYSNDANVVAAAQGIIDRFVQFGLPKERVAGGNEIAVKINQFLTNMPMVINLDDKEQTKSVRNASSQAWNYAKELRKSAKIAVASPAPAGMDSETYEAKVNMQKCIIDVFIEDNVVINEKIIQAQQKGLTENPTKSQAGTNTAHSQMFQEMLTTYNKLKSAQNLDNYVTIVSTDKK